MSDLEETLELIEKAQSGCNESKTILIEKNSPLIKSVIRRFKNRGVEYNDLYQLGSLGFLKAINNFDKSYNVKFSTYAVPMIAGEVKRFLRDDGYIKVSRATKALSTKILFFTEEYRKKNLKEPAVNEIAEHFNIEAEEVVFAMESAKTPVSIFEKTDEQSDKSQNLIDKLIVDDNSEDLIDLFLLKKTIKELSQREKKIIMLRFYRDKTQSEVAEHLGVSQVQVSRLESKIIEKIKKSFEM